VTIGRIVEEGISNAIRHGKATSIDISVTRVDELTVRVEVLDNGHGPQGGKASVGSAFVQQASSGRWSLTACSSGSQLEALVTA
jgi:signal transduction histidine kinase